MNMHCFERIERCFIKIKTTSFWKVLLMAVAFHLIWTFVIGGILLLSGVEFSQNVAPDAIFKNSFLLLPFAAFAEEVIFRWMPMFILYFVLMYCFRSGRISKESFFIIERYCLLAVVTISCIIFGWVHGNIFNVLLQGVTGFVIFIIYMRCFFIERDKGVNDRLQIAPLMEATLYHSLINSISI